MGYLGIAQVACTCTVGTLPSGVTVKSNTAATASKAGSVVLSFAANATLGGATVLNGTIDLTFTVSGASVVKKFAWTKSNKGSNGASGAMRLCSPCMHRKVLLSLTSPAALRWQRLVMTALLRLRQELPISGRNTRVANGRISR